MVEELPLMAWGLSAQSLWLYSWVLAHPMEETAWGPAVRLWVSSGVRAVPCSKQPLEGNEAAGWGDAPLMAQRTSRE